VGDLLLAFIGVTHVDVWVEPGFLLLPYLECSPIVERARNGGGGGGLAGDDRSCDPLAAVLSPGTTA
jgi:hypothetical protein